MRIVAISDTHNQHRKINLPDGDVLIHAGDISALGSFDEIAKFGGWLQKIKHKFRFIVVVAGNHDIVFEKNRYLAASMIQPAFYLENNGVEIEGLKIWGSPITPTFYNWAFMRDRGEDIKRIWNQIPNELDILITHGPPFGILDFNGRDLCGCSDLAKAVVDKKPKHHIFGHLHNSYGQKEIGETKFYNVSICNEAYKPINSPTIIEV